MPVQEARVVADAALYGEDGKCALSGHAARVEPQAGDCDPLEATATQRGAEAGGAPSGETGSSSLLGGLSEKVALAVGRGDEAVVGAWLDSGGQVDATFRADDAPRNVCGATALALAASTGQERMVDLLLQHGAEINKQNSHGMTALMYAALFHPATLLCLLRAGADTKLRTEDGKSALQLAKENGHAACVDAFRKHIAEVTAAQRRAEDQAVKRGDEVAVGAWLDSGGLSEEVAQAVKRGDEAAVGAWLDSGGQVDATIVADDVGGVDLSGTAVLAVAASLGQERVVDLLLQRGAEIDQPNRKGQTALMHAATKGHERVVDLLIRRGADAKLQNREGVTALMGAATKGWEGVFDLLLQRGAEINKQDNDGATALMYAASHGQPAIVLRLLRAGADTTARGVDDMTALQLAKEMGHAACVRALKEHAAAATAKADAAEVEMRAAQEAEVRKVERAAAEATAARHAEALLAQEEAEKEAEERAKESKKGKKKRKKAKGGGGGAGPSREPEDESALAAEEAELAAAFDRSARLEDEARRAAEEQAPPAESAGDSPPSEEQPATALSLADAKFDTGRAAVPESTLGGETTCIVCFTRPKTHVAGPCGHQCVCGPCSDRLQLCPYCREPVVMWIATRIV